MAQTPVEVKMSAPARTPDVWHSLRSEIDRLFDRFARGFGLPTVRRMFEDGALPRAAALTLAKARIGQAMSARRWGH